MKRSLSPYEVGGALYLPATHKNLRKVLLEAYYPFVQTVIIDFEDAINDDDYMKVKDEMDEILAQLPQQKLLVFIRPRDHEHLQRLLKLAHIQKIDGFVLAKFDTKHMKKSMALIPKGDFWVMPVLESKELFDIKKREKIAKFLIKVKEDILLLRFGAEDLSSHLGLKRNCETLLYDLPSLSLLLNQIILQFKPLGFVISAPVYTCFSNEKGFEAEVKKDLLSGLFGKTLIHPQQSKQLNALLKVSQEDLSAAKKSLEKDVDAIFAHEGMMIETVPHRRWADGIIKRSEVYGVA